MFRNANKHIPDITIHAKPTTCKCFGFFFFDNRLWFMYGSVLPTAGKSDLPVYPVLCCDLVLLIFNVRRSD